jgi:hypothetical protein
MRITALNRGGLAVYGGLYDPHLNEAVVSARDGETVALTIEYPSAPTSPSKTEDGVTCTTPTVVTGSNKVTATLSALQDGGYVDLSATVGGVTRTVRIRARTATSTDRYPD